MRAGTLTTCNTHLKKIYGTSASCLYMLRETSSRASNCTTAKNGKLKPKHSILAEICLLPNNFI